jgi:VWFA-related protein
MRQALLCTLGILLLSPLASNSQQAQQPKFNAQVNLVSLDVEVLDPLGNPVPGLLGKDFTITENGKPMEITNFSWQADRPVSLAMVLDTSAIALERLISFKRFILELAKDLARTDELCLYSFDSKDVYLEMEFTSQRRTLEDTLDNISVPSKGSGGTLAELFRREPPTGLAIDRGLFKLRSAHHPKKALLVISNRFRGLGPATVEHVQQSGATLLTLGFNNSAALLVTLGGDQISKNALMKESGGRQFSADTGDLEGVCRKIAFSLKNYYALGYLTEVGAAEEKPRRLEVRVPGQNYTINYRRTYIAN